MWTVELWCICILSKSVDPFHFDVDPDPFREIPTFSFSFFTVENIILKTMIYFVINELIIV